MEARVVGLCFSLLLFFYLFLFSFCFFSHKRDKIDFWALNALNSRQFFSFCLKALHWVRAKFGSVFDS